jgi:hypothetical protein
LLLITSLWKLQLCLCVYHVYIIFNGSIQLNLVFLNNQTLTIIQIQITLNVLIILSPNLVIKLLYRFMPLSNPIILESELILKLLLLITSLWKLQLCLCVYHVYIIFNGRHCCTLKQLIKLIAEIIYMYISIFRAAI